MSAVLPEGFEHKNRDRAEEDPWIAARETAFDSGPPRHIADQHRSLRAQSNAIRGALAKMASGQARADAEVELLERLDAFVTALARHFAAEEAACTSITTASPMHHWVATIAREHVSFKQRFDAHLRVVRDAVAARSRVPDSTCADLTACLDDLVQHELTESRLFQISVLGH